MGSLIEDFLKIGTYDPNEPRRWDGEWTTGSGGGAVSTMTELPVLSQPTVRKKPPKREPIQNPIIDNRPSQMPPVTLRPSKQRAWEGVPIPLTPAAANEKQVTGAIGQVVAIAYLKSIGILDAEAVNSTQSNFPVDGLGDSSVYEFKAGLVSNSKKAQRWRCSIGEKSKARKALEKQMTPFQRRAVTEQQNQDILDRKEEVVMALDELRGIRHKRVTIAMILNPNTKTADIHVIDGFHTFVGWSSKMAKDGYVGSFNYE